MGLWGWGEPEARVGSVRAGTGGRGAPVWLVGAALVCLYVVWGSTYLGIKWAVEGFPPLFLAGVRSLIAGGLIYGVARARGAERPTRAQWRAAAVIGGLLLLGGNGAVTVASQWVPSSVCALIVAALPVWMVVLDRRGPRASVVTWTGVVVGLAGVALLIGPRVVEAVRGGAWSNGGGAQALGMTLLVGSSICWASGSLYARSAPRPASGLASVGMQLTCGGALLMVASAAMGEPARLSLEAMFGQARPGLALAYLIVFGSVLGYTSYIWLLEVASPAVVSTYAYVNPVVAVALGAWLGGERLSARVLMAAAVILAGVVVIVSGGRRGKETRRRPDDEMQLALAGAAAGEAADVGARERPPERGAA